MICDGCIHAYIQERSESGGLERIENTTCPFCRAPYVTGEASLSRHWKRIEAKDVEAFFQLGCMYKNGEFGLPQSLDKAMELWLQGVELGSIKCHAAVGGAYFFGRGVEQNVRKAKHHYQIAARGGHIDARQNLAAIEQQEGNFKRSMKHLIVLARTGHDVSLKGVWTGYKRGLVTKDDLDATLRAHKDSQDEMKSENRDRVKQFMQKWGP